MAGALVAWTTPDKTGPIHATASRADDIAVCDMPMRSFGGRVCGS
jgi:hypothetical protein